MEVVPKRHAVALRLLEALKEEAKVALDPGTSEALLYTDALARARLIEVTHVNPVHYSILCTTVVVPLCGLARARLIEVIRVFSRSAALWPRSRWANRGGACFSHTSTTKTKNNTKPPPPLTTPPRPNPTQEVPTQEFRGRLSISFFSGASSPPPSTPHPHPLVSRSMYVVRHPRNRHTNPLLSLAAATSENKSMNSKLSSKSALQAVHSRGCSLAFMRVADLLTVLRAQSKQCLSGL